MRAKALIFAIAVSLLAPFTFAETVGTSSNPHLAKAMELRSQAKSVYDTGDYDAATSLARQAKAELALIAGSPAQAVADALPLPASYTVRLIPDDRDCLSKIAGYPFVYGDRSQWPLIYRANKATLKHPENADIILQGEVLVIPSIAGETRAGAWEEGKDYPSYTPASK
jgi:hypothetical protein